MTTAHALVMYGLPLVIGGLAGAVARRGRWGVSAHAGLGIVAFLATEVLLYTVLYLRGVAAAGGRVGPHSFVEAMAGLFSRYGALFLIVSAATALPLTAVGYAVGASLAGRAGKRRGEGSHRGE